VPTIEGEGPQGGRVGTPIVFFGWGFWYACYVFGIRIFVIMYAYVLYVVGISDIRGVWMSM